MRLLYFYIAAVTFFFAPALASAATLELWPELSSVKAGDIVSVRVLVSSDQAFNAVDGRIIFSPSLLQVVSISKFNSVISLWVQDPTYSNTEGSISFSGGIPNPGYVGSERRVITVQFRARRSGAATVAFGSASVLANDGSGTNILTDTKTANFSITEGSAQSTPQVPPAEPSAAATEPAPAQEAAPFEDASRIVIPAQVSEPAFDIVKYVMESEIPLLYFLIYVAATLVIFVGFLGYYMLGLRIRVYRVKPSAKTPKVVARLPEKT